LLVVLGRMGLGGAVQYRGGYRGVSPLRLAHVSRPGSSVQGISREMAALVCPTIVQWLREPVQGGLTRTDSDRIDSEGSGIP
jgi:hypothetical protein